MADNQKGGISRCIAESYHHFCDKMPSKMDLPDNCPNCNQINMVDWERLETRPVSALYVVLGYHCKACGCWKPCTYSTRQLDGNLRRLILMRPDHPSFYYHLVKTVRRAEEIQRRGRELNGSIQHRDVASAGRMG